MITAEFTPLLRAHDLDALETYPSSVIGTWPDLTLAFANEAWTTFALENGGQTDRLGLGICILGAIPPVLLPFYREHFDAVLKNDQPWEHVYECSSPDICRLFHMLVYPLSGRQGLLIVHSLRRESPHDHVAKDWAEEYEAVDGFVHQCAHCRRIQRSDNSHQWDWVPELVRVPRSNTSHGLCELCYSHYYKEGRQITQPPTSTIDSGDGI